MAGGGLNDSMNSGKSPAGRVGGGVRAIVSNAAALASAFTDNAPAAQHHSSDNPPTSTSNCCFTSRGGNQGPAISD